MTLDFYALADSLGVPSTKAVLPDGHEKTVYHWTVEQARKAMEQIQTLAHGESEIVAVGHPTKYLLCAAAIACQDSGFSASIPALGVTVEFPVLPVGPDETDKIAHYEIREEADRVYIKTSIQGGNSHPPIDSMAQMVPKAVPAGRDVFIDCDGIPLISVFWAKAYAVLARSVWINETRGDKDYFCVYTTSQEIPLFSEEHLA